MAVWNFKDIGQQASQPSLTELIATGPVQPVLVQHEWKGSRVISEDVQRGTITVEYIVDGTPDEVWAGSGQGGFRIGDALPGWGHEHAFIVHRHFEHHVYGGSSTSPKTLVRYTYQQRPCLGLYEEDLNVSLVGYQTYWSYDNPPQAMSLTPAQTFNILFPQIVYRRRWPRIRMHYSEIINLYEQQGKTNPDAFMGQDQDFWLCDGVQAKLLYGRTTEQFTELSVWDISIIFRGDPWRHHEFWYPRFDAGRPVSNRFEDMRAVHVTRKQYLRSSTNFSDLVDTSASLPGDCLPPPP